MSTAPTDVIADLRARGTLKDVTHEDLGQLMANDGPWTVYNGFDPSGDSLHIGNLVPLIALRRLQLAGHNVIALAGGATGMIGDPSGRSDERNLLDEETLAANTEGIRADMAKIIDLDGTTGRLVNNADWFRDVKLIDFLRDAGKHFRVNTMLAMTSVKDRLESQTGISFTEFSYALIQAWDFFHLFREYGCTLQAGGSDQWGNIVAGIDLIDRKLGKQAFGMTYELLLDDNGVKFGKSTGGGSLFMSARKTSPYRLYQHLLNTRDEVDAGSEVERYLKTFTFIPVAEIDELVAAHNQDKPARAAQRRLAEEVVRLLHDEAGLTAAKTATDVMFGQADVRNVDDDVLSMIFADIDHRAELPVDRLAGEGLSVLDAFVETGLVQSRGEAKKLVKNNGAFVNADRVTDPQATITADTLAGKQTCMLRAGKKNRALLRFG